MRLVQFTQTKPKHNFTELFLGSSPDVLKDCKKDFAELTEKLDELLLKIIERLTAFYDRQLGTPWSNREVELLQYRSLTFFLRQYLGIHYLLTKGNWEGSSLVALEEKDFLYSNSDYELTNLIKNSDLFALQIATTVAKYSNIKIKKYRRSELNTISYDNQNTASKTEHRDQINSFFSNLADRFKQVLRKKGLMELKGIVGLQGALPTKRKNFTDILIKVPTFSILVLFKRNYRQRAALRKAIIKETDAPLLKGCLEAWSYAMPTVYLEGLPRLHRETQKMVEKCDAANFFNLVFDRLYYLHERFFVMECIRSKQARIHWFQHGSVYGESKMAIWENAETRIADFFYTWGWKKSPKHVVSSALKLTLLQPIKKEERGNSLVWLTRGSIGTLGWEFMLYYDYYRVQEEFYNSLSMSVREQLILRLLMSKHSDEAVISPWRKKYLSIKVDYKEGNLVDKLKKAKLVVIDYFFSTALAECFVTDTPVIVFEENTYPAFTDMAYDTYDALIKAEVVHTSSESAANFVNKKFENVYEWWNKPDVKSAVKAYLTTFGSITNQPRIYFDENT